MKTILIAALVLLSGCCTDNTPTGSGGPDTFEATNIYPWTPIKEP